MPEIPISKTPVMTAASTEIIVSSETKNRIRKDGMEYLGDGAGRLVIADPRRPDKALAFSKSYMPFTSDQAKRVYYFYSILNTVFPHNFPHVYSATGAESAETVPFFRGTVRERIVAKRTYPLLRRFQIRYPFSQVERICKKLDIPLYTDRHSKNFIVGKDGGEYYVDMTSPPQADRLNALVAYMGDKFSQTDVQKVQRQINRLRILQNRR
ncbi:MAG TPA: hypothetical protein VLF20_00345 [Patescibacteria group bacterium]|nr:hypothetical protein [Patescibacteria group bacterium]